MPGACEWQMKGHTYVGTHVARACFSWKTKTSLLSHRQIAKVLEGYYGCLRTEDEVEGSKHGVED